MDLTLFLIIAFAFLGGVLSVIAASVFLLLSENWRIRILPTFVSFAIGALLGASFLALLPHGLSALGDNGVYRVSVTVLLGLLGFFILEKLVIWRHCHTAECEAHGVGVEEMQKIAAGKLILIGDGIHNFVDGILIAAAFLTDVYLGVVTSIAVIAHEIPQEVGDFAVLLNSGYSRARAFTYNILTSLTTIVGGIMAYFFLHMAQSIVPYVLAVAAASFIYVAVADLIPGLHRRYDMAATVHQVGLITLGVLSIAFAQWLVH